MSPDTRSLSHFGRLFGSRSRRSSETLGPTESTSNVKPLFPLPAEALVGVRGESYYPAAVRELTRNGARELSALTLVSGVAADVAQREPSRKLRWFDAQLIPEPDNPYDANAVAVISPHGQVGHLPRESASGYAALFQMLRKLGYSGAACPAFLDVRTKSVVLVLSHPTFCMPAVSAERRERAWEAWHANSDLGAAAATLGFKDVSTLLKGARQHAKERGLPMPPTASELSKQEVAVVR